MTWLRWLGDVPKTLWAYVFAQVLTLVAALVLVALPGETWSFETSRESIWFSAAYLLIVYFLLRGRRWAWGLLVGLGFLGAFSLIMMGQIAPEAAAIAAPWIFGLWLLFRPATRHYVDPHRPRLLASPSKPSA